MPDGLLDVIEMLEMWDDNWIYGAVPLAECQINFVPLP